VAASAAVSPDALRPKFALGLSMAGAVSAGSYTAGVVDFLFEALDALEAAKRRSHPTTNDYEDPDGCFEIFDPGHNVQIGAMSGTSAGAMVTATAACVANTTVTQVYPKLRDNLTKVPSDKTGNPFYDAWVIGHQKSKNTYAEYIDQLLGDNDLQNGNTEVKSLLDATVVQQTIHEIISNYSIRNDHPRAYFGADLPVYLCLANMRGVDYLLPMNGPGPQEDTPTMDGAGHRMRMHADFMAFIINTKTTRLGFVPLNNDRAAWDQLGLAAQASGAFPLALPAVMLKRPFSDYEYLDLNWGATGGAGIKPPPPPRPLKPKDCATDYDFSCVDGGTFNNEPFELCRKELEKRGEIEKHSAVVLIDPFPEAEAATNSLQIVHVLQSLLISYIAQSRFKPQELCRASNNNDTSLWAILPRRENSGSLVLATGFLRAFGGFLFKECRHHDYLLGRRNCQQFLRKHLVLDKDDELFVKWPPEMQNKYLVDQQYLPVVPLLGKLAREDYTKVPAWPTVELKSADLRKKVKRRMANVKDALLSSAGLKAWHKLPVRVLIQVAYWLFSGRLISLILTTIESAAKCAYLL